MVEQEMTLLNESIENFSTSAMFSDLEEAPPLPPGTPPPLPFETFATVPVDTADASQSKTNKKGRRSRRQRKAAAAVAAAAAAAVTATSAPHLDPFSATNQFFVPPLPSSQRPEDAYRSSAAIVAAAVAAQSCPANFSYAPPSLSYFHTLPPQFFMNTPPPSFAATNASSTASTSHTQPLLSLALQTPPPPPPPQPSTPPPPPPPPPPAQPSSATAPKNLNESKSLALIAKQLDDWPSSLTDYVNRCYGVCESPIDRQRFEIILKGKITKSVSSGELWTHDWQNEPLPTTIGSANASSAKTPLKNQIVFGKINGFSVKKGIVNGTSGQIGGLLSARLGTKNFQNSHSSIIRTFPTGQVKRNSSSDDENDENDEEREDVMNEERRGSNGNENNRNSVQNKMNGSMSRNGNGVNNGNHKKYFIPFVNASSSPSSSSSSPMSSSASMVPFEKQTKNKSKNKNKKRKEIKPCNQIVSSSIEGNDEVLRKRAERFQLNVSATTAVTATATPSFVARSIGSSLSGSSGYCKGSAAVAAANASNKYLDVSSDRAGRDDGTDFDWSSQFHVIGTSQAIEKRFLRLTKAPDPCDVRPVEVLHLSLAHVQQKWTAFHDYRYACNQLKSIRQDLTVQGIRNSFTIKVYETHARIALEVKDHEEFNQCQTQLKTLHDNTSENRLEFIAYRILYYIFTKNTLDLMTIIKSLSEDDKKNECIKHSLAIRSAWSLNNFHKFFILYRNSPSMSAFLIDWFVERERKQFLKQVIKSYRQTITVEFICKEMVFDSLEKCIEFLDQLHIRYSNESKQAIDCKESTPLLATF